MPILTLEKMDNSRRIASAEEMSHDLYTNILPYWIGKMKDPRGGYYGKCDGNDRLHSESPKGAIMHGRILWTMSASYNAVKNPEYLKAAEWAYRYIMDKFVDHEFGGVFQSVTADGKPLDTKKQFYAIAFVIYGLSEYFKGSGNKEALEAAVSLFNDIEKYSRDNEQGGYIEAKTREWKAVDDMRLSDKDSNSCKTMNTHLHILEAYTSLYKVWKNHDLEKALRNLLNIFIDKIIDRKNHHLGLFFDNDWKRQDSEISYGHDIEASWLLLEAAEAIGDEELLESIREITRKTAEAALEGRCADGSMVYERHGSGSYDNEKHWWVQAEAVVGQLYMWKYHGIEGMDDKALETWNYIKDNLIDRKEGEWYWSRLPDGSVNRKEDKAGYWKCPYHNGRMILESVGILRH